MTHIPIMPFTVAGLSNALDALSTYAAETNPFTFSREGSFGTAVANNFKVEQPDSLRALLFGQAGSFIDIYGGEWEFDGFSAILHKERGADNGVTIRYGKNLTDLKQEENIESTYTGICPYWKGQDSEGTDLMVTLPEKVLHSNFAANYPYQRTKIVDMSTEFQTQPTVEQLRTAGQRYIETNDVGSPSVSLDVAFVALHQTQEYADLTRIEHINLCDTVKVVFPALNVSTKAKVVKTVWNVLMDRYNSITIGVAQGRLSATLQESQERAVEQAVAQSATAASTEYATKSALQAVSGSVGQVDVRMYRAENYINAMKGTNGGYVFITLDENNQTDELIVLADSPVFATAQKVFRFNESGLCYTAGGYERGSWTTIIDNTGKVNTAVLSGILTDVASKNSWNLTTGAMALASDITIGGKSIATIVGELMPDVSGALSTALNAFDTNLDQAAVLAKLQAGTNPADDSARTDAGLYLGADGYLHMLPERVIIEALEVSQTTQANMASLTARAEAAAESAEDDASAASSAATAAASAKDTAVAAVSGFNTTVNNATTSAVATVQGEGTTQVARIQSAADGIEDYVEGVVNDGKDDIDDAKDAAVAAVGAAQATAVGAVNDAKDDAMSDISDAADEIMEIKTSADTTAALALQQANSAINEVAGVENSVQGIQTDFATLQALVGGKVDGGYVENDSLYLTSNGEVVAGPFTGFGGGGSGGSGGGTTNAAVMTVTNTSGFVSTTIASGATCTLSLTWSSIEDNMPTGNGSLTIKVNGTVKAILDVAQGSISANVGPYLSAGNNNVQLLVTDSYGNSRVKNFTVTVVELTLSSSFDDSVVQNGVLAFPYTPYGSVSKTMHFILDGTELETASTAVSGRQQTYIISAQNHGAHTLRVYFEASINGNTVRSNELYYEIIWARPLVTTPVIASSFSGTNIMQFTTVNIPYIVYC